MIPKFQRVYWAEDTRGELNPYRALNLDFQDFKVSRNFGKFKLLCMGSYKETKLVKCLIKLLYIEGNFIPFDVDHASRMR